MTIEIIKLPNALKQKLGIDANRTNMDGHIDPASIEEADQLIADMCKSCKSSIARFLSNLNKIWADMKDVESDARDALAQTLFTQAHEIKDIASMCGYDLIAEFAESLRDYINQTELSLEAQRVIIQAHIDAITVAHKNDIRVEGGASADELKTLIKIAIDKYS